MTKSLRKAISDKCLKAVSTVASECGDDVEAIMLRTGLSEKQVTRALNQL